MKSTRAHELLGDLEWFRIERMGMANIRVRVCRSSGAIDLIDLGQRELDLLLMMVQSIESTSAA